MNDDKYKFITLPLSSSWDLAAWGVKFKLHLLLLVLCYLEDSSLGIFKSALTVDVDDPPLLSDNCLSVKGVSYLVTFTKFDTTVGQYAKTNLWGLEGGQQQCFTTGCRRHFLVYKLAQESDK